MNVKAVLNGSNTLVGCRTVSLPEDFVDLAEQLRIYFDIPLATPVAIYTHHRHEVTKVADILFDDVLVVCRDGQDLQETSGIVADLEQMHRDSLLLSLKEVKDSVLEYHTAAEVIELAIKNLDSTLNTVKANISRTIEGFIAALHLRRESLIKEAEEIKKKKQLKLMEQKKQVLELAGSQKQLSVFESRINTDNIADLHQIQEQLEKMKIVISCATLSLAPCEDDSLAVEIPLNFADQIASLGRIEWNDSIETNPSPQLEQARKVTHQVSLGNIVVSVEGGEFHTSAISVSPSSSDPGVASFAFQWYRQEMGNTFTIITGANQSKYQPTANDLHANLRVYVTPIMVSGSRGRTVNIDIPSEMLTLDPKVAQPVEENIQHGECIFDIFRKRTPTQEAEERSLWFSPTHVVVKKSDSALGKFEYGPNFKVVLPVTDSNTIIFHFDNQHIEELVCPSPLYRDILALTVRSFSCIHQVQRGLATPAQFRPLLEARDLR